VILFESCCYDRLKTRKIHERELLLCMVVAIYGDDWLQTRYSIKLSVSGMYVCMYLKTSTHYRDLIPVPLVL
jgi:hypothetical protein